MHVIEEQATQTTEGKGGRKDTIWKFWSYIDR